ncbi:MAG: hypothetical protein LBQ38_08615, partial [Spirochaetaceae bacterium]|nr:hypothetical protein [Spirochaetaceae bacterium]
MNNKLLLLCLVFLLFGILPDCFAQDFGLIINQKALLPDNEQSLDGIEYSAGIIPWFSAPLGDRADFYFSGGLSAQYDDEEWKPLPEIYRFEFMYNPLPNLRLEIGRVPFRQNLSLVFAGLADGLSAGLTTGGGRLNGGLFYTGLLYKKAAYIYMSPADRADYSDKAVYFASRRLIAALNWEKTSVFDTQNNLSLSGVCQFDLNETDAQIHSQYLEARFTVPLGAHFNTVSGAVIELAEETGKDPYAAFVFSAEVQWLPPTAITDVLSVTGRFSSGAWNDTFGPFILVTAEAQGKVLRPMLSGIALAEAAYTARLHRTLSAAVSGAYFFRTDKITYTAPDLDTLSDSPLLGAEIYGG